MGGTLSKINYYKINKVIDIAQKNNKYGHKLLLTNGNEQIVYFTEKEESKFKIGLEYSNMYKPIIKLNYENVKDLKDYNCIHQNGETITNFTVEYNNGTLEKFMLNSFQLDLFWKLFKQTQKGKEIKNRLQV